MSQFQPPPSDPNYPPIQPAPHLQQMDAPGATAGLVLGIISIVFNVPVVGFILALIGFTQSKSALAACDLNPYYTNRGVAQAGYVCSIIGMCISGLSTLCLCGYFGFFGLMFVGGAASGP